MGPDVPNKSEPKNLCKIPVNFDLISKTIDLYKKRGFIYIETPYIVSQEAIQETFKDSTPVSRMGLVGSAEQGFIELANRGLLREEVNYVSAGPCFRDEPVDRLHQTEFFKVELCKLSYSKPVDLRLFTTIIKQILSDLLNISEINLQIKISGENQLDICYNDLELGSYGVRQLKSGLWLRYGTGLAEPRASIIKHLHGL